MDSVIQSTQQTTQTPIQETPFDQRRRLPIFIYILLGIILLGAGGVGGFYYANTFLPTPTTGACTEEAKFCPDGTSVGRIPPKCEFSACPTFAPNSSENWPEFKREDISFRHPIAWAISSQSATITGYNVIFKDPSDIYTLTLTKRQNLNQQTGKAFATLKELTGFPYDVPSVTVSGQQAAQVLPRAGSEHIYSVELFSKDRRFIYSLELETPRDGLYIEQGKLLFDQILASVVLIDVQADKSVPGFKVYTDTTYKFQVSYPDGWIVEPVDYKTNAVASPDQPQLLVDFKNKIEEGLATPGLVRFDVIYIKPKVTFADYVTSKKNEANISELKPLSVAETAISIAGTQGKQVVYAYGDHSFTVVYIPREDGSVFEFQSGGFNEDLTTQTKYYNQIYPTLKFIK